MSKRTGKSGSGVKAKTTLLNLPPSKLVDEKTHYDRGVKSVKEGKYNDAISELEKAVYLNPHNELYRKTLGQANFLNGISFYNNGKLSNAIAGFRNALQVDPFNASYLYNLGLAYHKNKNVDKAIEAYTRALKIIPDDPDLRYRSALAYLDKGDSKAVISLAEEGVKRFSGRRDSWVWQWLIAISYAISGECKRALNLFKDIEVEENLFSYVDHPLTANFFWGMGLLNLEENNYEDAEKYLSESSRLFADNPIADYYYGLALLGSDKIDEAVLYMENAFEQGLNSMDVRRNLTNAMYELALLYEEKSEMTEALELLERAWQIYPQSIKEALVKIYFEFGLALAKEEKFDEAILEWSKIEKIDPDNNDALHNIALAYERMDMHDKAKHYWERAIKNWKKEHRRKKKTGEDSEVAQYLGVAHAHLAKDFMKKSEFDRAVYEYEQAVKYRPHDSVIRLELVDVEFARGNEDKAKDILKEMVSEEPASIDALKRLSDICSQEGNIEAAVAYMEDVVHREPDDARNRIILARQYLTLVDELLNYEDHDDAMLYLEKARVLDPIEPKVFVLMGVIKFIRASAGGPGSRKMRSQAEELFEEAISLKPGEVAIPLEIGVRLMERGIEKVAREYLDMALEVEPHDKYTLWNIGKIYLDNGHDVIASKYFERIAQLSDDKAQEYLNIASNLYVNDEFHIAIKYFNKALESQDTSLSAEDETHIHICLSHCYHEEYFFDNRVRKELNLAAESVKRIEDIGTRLKLTEYINAQRELLDFLFFQRIKGGDVFGFDEEPI